MNQLFFDYGKDSGHSFFQHWEMWQLTVPVLCSFANSFPQHQVVVLSRLNMAALFTQVPSNVSFRGVDVKKEYAGIKGLLRLFSLLKCSSGWATIWVSFW